MTRKPYLKLRRRIEDQGLELKELAHQANIPRSTLNERINAPETQGVWRWKEIVAICKVVGIPRSQVGDYFFPCIPKEDRPA